MKRRAARPVTCLIAASLLCASCQPPGEQGPASLVGADRLPSAAALSREIVQINRGYGEVSEGLLSYEIRPDDSLTVTHSGRPREVVRGEERFRLAPDVADRARRRLWRLRPAKLEGVEAHEARPSGCERRGPHDFGELAVVFIDEGKAPGVGDDRLGTFELPAPDSCDSPAARQARALVRRVMDSFPPSRVADGFEPWPRRLGAPVPRPPPEAGAATRPAPALSPGRTGRTR